MSGLTGFDAWGDGPSVSSLPSSITFRTCYISHDTTKMCSPAYVRAFLATGRHVIFNFEDTAGVAGRNGTADAQYARDIIHRMYGFTNVPCIWSCDEDVPNPVSIDSYARAWASVFGAPKTGPYGEAAVINYCVNHNISQLGWLTNATSWTGGNDPTHAEIVQGGFGTIAGVSIDYDTIRNLTDELKVDEQPAPVVKLPVPPAPVFTQEELMQIEVWSSTSDPRVYAVHESGKMFHIAEPASLENILASKPVQFKVSSETLGNLKTALGYSGA